MTTIDLDYYDDECYGCEWKKRTYDIRPCKKCIRYTEEETDDDKYKGKDD